MNTKQELVENIITDNMGQFSTYVLLSRAIPDIRDGLKPSYRRVLWAMNEMKATSFTKSANIAGEVMRYHPHGSTYPTMVGMAQKDGQLNPYVIGKGNFGQHASELAYASDRYTEAKLSEISIDMLADTKKRGIEMIDNYDSTRKIPEVFPVKYPNVLAYAQSGIGVGFSSSIPSFNITELCEAVISYVEKSEKTYLIPDFGTKGYVINDPAIVKSINEDGRGSILQRAKAEIEGNNIVVTEIPYDTTKEKIIDKIIDLHKKDKLRELSNVNDVSGLSGMRIVITAKRNTDMNQFLEKMYRDTPMQASYSANMMVINTEGLPELKGVWNIIVEWLEWRKEVIRKMLNHDTRVKKAQLEILYGLRLIKDDVEKVIEIIRKSTDSNVIKNLQKEFGLSKVQAERISELKLRNLTSTFIKKQMNSIKDLETEVANNEKTALSDTLLDKVIVEDLKSVIKKFGKERQSIIIEKKEVLKDAKIIEDINNDIPDYNVRVFVTKENYIKKIPLTSLRGDFEIQVKDGDEIINEVETTNAEELLIFTNMNNVYKKKLHEIADSKPSGLGTFAPNEISMEKGEVIQNVSVVSKNALWMLFAFEDGKVAKVDLEAYRTKQNRSVLRNSHADKRVVLFRLLSEDIDLMATADNGKTVMINTSIINSKSSKTTQGSAFIKLKDGSVVREYQVIKDTESYEYYRLKSAGTGKYKK